MKTINTSLPIYDKVAKQCFERGKKGGFNRPVPILCPRHRLPSFQWLDNGDGAASVSKIELIDTLGETYNGDCRITYYSTNNFDTFVSSGLNITSAIVLGASNKYALTAPYYMAKTGEVIRLKYNFHRVSGAFAPYVQFYNNGGTEGGAVALVEGSNEILHTVLADSIAPDGVIIGVYSTLGPVSFTFIDVEITVDNINQLFPALPAATILTDTYFSYNGDTLNYLLPEGLYYLKITMDNGYVYYSEWFLVDCVYKNLITSWTNSTYETFTSSGTIITSAIETGIEGQSRSDSFNVIKDEQIRIIFNLTLNSGQLPTLFLINSGWTLADEIVVSEGLNDIILTSEWNGISNIVFRNTLASNFYTSEVLVIRSYSEKYLTINFSNDCDLGDILYHEGFTQTVWFESEPLEMSFPQEEQGMNNGDGRFVRAFARQVKKYVARTLEMPAFMVECFNRMKLHHEVELIDLVGDTNDIYNLEVAHEWIGDDKYYAKIDLTFDHNEAFVVAGCCNNIT